MNWLAHLRLAQGESLVRVGNLAGDFVRGVEVAGLHPELQRGIEHHRAIDRFVDRHPVFLRGRDRLAAPYRRFAGVALDVFFDHFLARDWERHGDGRALDEFVDVVHAELEEHRELLPPDLLRLHERMQEHRWLTMYGRLEGIERVLRAMAKRSRRAAPLATVTDELRRNYGELESDFRELWPELLAWSRARSDS